jgi:antitoxin component YwqK of YwqJK toxin-antitoxin module
MNTFTYDITTMKNKFVLIFFMSFLIINISNAQNKAITKSKSLPNNNTTKYYKTQHKSMEYAGGWAEFDFLVNNPNEKEYSDDVKYYWYNENLGINVTKGGSGGKLIHGVFYSYYSKRKLKAVVNFYLGEKSGLEKQWDSTGELISINKYSNNKLIYSKFNEPEEGLIHEWIGEPYSKNSILNLYNLKGYKNPILSKTEFINGISYKKLTDYDKIGKVKKVYYLDFVRRLDSIYVEYYDNGKIKVQGKYDEGFKTGDWYYYDYNGNLITNERFSVYRKYGDNNKLEIEYGRFYNFKTKEWIIHGNFNYYNADSNRILNSKSSTKKYYLGAEVDKDYIMGNPEDFIRHE